MPAAPSHDPGSARSIDGRTFDYLVPAESPLVAGDLVLLALPAGISVCGQLLDKQFDGTGCAGTGSIVGSVDGDGGFTFGSTEPFGEVSLLPATPEIVEAVQSAASATIPVGTMRGGRAMLRAEGFNRHTFMCGQSESGKSYALGVLLEQVLLDTDLPVVVLDPNADLVHLTATAPTATEDERERLGGGETTVLRPHPDDGGLPLRVRFSTLSNESKAAILRLDPLADRDEFHSLLEVSELMRTTSPAEAVDELMRADSVKHRMLAHRVENLGVLDWEVWAGETTTAVEVLDKGPRAMVLDLSGFEHHRERLVVAVDVLEHLWATRERNYPRLLAIDDAHHFCTASPADPLENVATDRLIQIATEGRRYGLSLLLASQRPMQIHPAVLSQCDNVVVMKTGGRTDVEQLDEAFDFIPSDMLTSTPGFGLGECLMAGAFIPAPAFVQIGTRKTPHRGPHLDPGLDFP